MTNDAREERLSELSNVDTFSKKFLDGLDVEFSECQFLVDLGSLIWPGVGRLANIEFVEPVVVHAATPDRWLNRLDGIIFEVLSPGIFDLVAVALVACALV